MSLIGATGFQPEGIVQDHAAVISTVNGVCPSWSQ